MRALWALDTASLSGTVGRAPGVLFAQTALTVERPVRRDSQSHRRDDPAGGLHPVFCPPFRSVNQAISAISVAGFGKHGCIFHGQLT